MNDSTRFMLIYTSMLLSCKDEELADFLTNTVVTDIELHKCSIEKLKEIRDEIVRLVVNQTKDELDEIYKIQPLEYKLEYDGQINLWSEFYSLGGITRMKDTFVRLAKEGE